MDEAISTLLFLAFIIFCTYLDAQCRKERAQRERDADTSDQGWGSFDADGGDGPDYGGF